MKDVRECPVLPGYFFRRDGMFSVGTPEGPFWKGYACKLSGKYYRRIKTVDGQSKLVHRMIGFTFCHNPLPKVFTICSEDISKSWYEELERDIPGIDSTVIELLKTQILGLCYFLKLSNKCHEIWPSGRDDDEPRKWSGFSRFAKVRSTLRVNKRRYFACNPMKQCFLNTALLRR